MILKGSKFPIDWLEVEMRLLNPVLAACASVVVLCGSAERARAQVEVAQPSLWYIGETFYMDAITFADRESPRTRLDVFAHVGYEMLSFVKQGGEYSAMYEMTVSVYDSDETLVNEKLWTEEIQGVSFDESVSPDAYRLSQRNIVLDPGRYRLAVIMRDLETDGTRSLVRSVRVPDYTSPPFSMSDVLLISRITEREERRSIVPNVSGNVANIPDSFYVFFEVYNGLEVDTVRFIANFVDKKNETVLVQDTLQVLRPGRNEALLRIYHSSLPLGDYSIIIRAFPPESASVAPGKQIGQTSRYVSVRWEGLPKAVKDLDLAIDQLRYIARDEELSALDDAETTEEKQEAFLAFWKKRDPNPNTPRNEKMMEYYRRVAYSDRHFSHHIDGWRTDMGMVFIIFGPPDDVERNPFDLDRKPNETWRYYAINYQFYFEDQTGFGDYRLLTPIWEAWKRADTWGRY